MNLEFNRSEDVLKQSLSEMRQRLDKIYEGGGKKIKDKQKEKKTYSTGTNRLFDQYRQSL